MRRRGGRAAALALAMAMAMLEVPSLAAAGPVTIAQAAAPGSTSAATLRLAPDGTVLADRDILDCVILQPPARNGSAPRLELVERLIRCLYERPSIPGSDGATTVDLFDIKVGAPKRDLRIQDIGAETRTWFYGVHATWNLTVYRRDRTTVRTNENVFRCYVNILDVWQCSDGDAVKQGEERRLR